MHLNKVIFNKFPVLFHKYLLGLSDPNSQINYKITYCKFLNKNNYFIAHLHCYNLNLFKNIYSKYLEKITNYFDIIITYSKGSSYLLHKYIIKYNKFINIFIIKIKNIGKDIGAKFSAVKYLNDIKYPYKYILFLHSKSNLLQRNQYFTKILDNINNKFIKNIYNYDSYFPNLVWCIIKNYSINLTNNVKFIRNKLYKENNIKYRNNLLKYLEICNNTNLFIEGNIYILSNNIINKLFTDKFLYNILNKKNSYDYNYICVKYNLNYNIYKTFEFYSKLKNIDLHNSKDSCIEHVFERIILNLCNNYKIL